MEDIEKIKRMQRILETSKVTSEGRLLGDVLRGVPNRGVDKRPGTMIFEALEKKTFYKEADSKTILAFTDTTLIEVTPAITNEIIDAVRKYTDVFKRNVKEKGITVDGVAEILGIYEGAYSAYLNTTKYERLRKELCEYLKEQYDNGDEETKKRMNKAYVKFFSASKANISRGLLKFPNMKFRVNRNGDKVYDESVSKLSIRVEEDKESLRNEFIFKCLEDGLWDYDYLFENGIVNGLGGYDVNTFVRNSNALTVDEKINAFIVSGVCEDRQEVVDYYREHDKRFFVDIASIEEIIDAIKSGDIAVKDSVRRLKIADIAMLSPEKIEELLSIPGFPKNTEFLSFVPNKKTGKTDKIIKKELFKQLDRESIMKIVLSDSVNEIYVNPLESKDYIDMFGKLNLDDIKKLEEKGFIFSEDIIGLSKFTSLKETEPDAYQEMLNYILEYYDLEKLKKLLEQGKINAAFVKMFDENVLLRVSAERKDEYFTNLYYDLENGNEVEKEENQKLLIRLLKKGFTIPADDKYNISNEIVTDMYLEDEIDDEFIMELYYYGFVKSDLILSMYSSDEILKKYREGFLSVSFLNFVDSRQEVIREELENGNINLEDVILLYAEKDGINIEELRYIFEKQSLENDNLAEFIPDDMEEGKIEGLFESYFISHDDLSTLVSRGIISSEDAEEYANKMVTHDVFESIFGHVTKAILTRDTEEGESRTPGLRVGPNKRAGQIKNDPFLQKMLLDEIGFDDRELVLRGENNSLDGYTVRASDKYGIMVFSNYDKAGNATYVMSLQQGLFFLNRLVRKRTLETGTEVENVDSVESTATKQELRETEHVKVRNASRWLGRNIVDSMRKVSDKFARDYRKEQDYKTRIDELVDAIRDDYDERKRD